MRKFLISFIILTIGIIFLIPNKVCAEGSYDLIKDSPPTSYRPYLEWQTGNTLGIPRKNNIIAYVIAGENIKFGGSVYNSYDNQDITVTFPDNSVQVFDVLQTGLGYIDTVVKEANGPYPLDGGYTPLEIIATQTGFYTFQFHGVTGGNTNPTPVTIGADFTINQASNVAAWDVTVESSGIEETGRVFASYLALNLGRSTIGEDLLKTDLYILTQDGYLYDITLDNIDPFGFIVYSNNRGLVNGTDNTALYHSAKATNNQFVELIGDILVPQPQNGDTEEDIFHRIFFNIPSNSLPPEIPIQAIPPATATNFRFEGEVSNVTKQGEGGYFSFDVDRITTYQIEITTNTGTFIIGNTTTVGNNRVFWDGRDDNGNIVEPGNYSAILKIKGGEYHFPFFDVENNDTTTIQLLNPPYTYPGFNPYQIYYNNENYEIGGIFVDLSGPGITNPVNASIEGIDSSQPGSVKFTDSYGDEKVIDIWTFFNSEEVTTNIVIVSTQVNWSIVIIELIIGIIGIVSIIWCRRGCDYN